MNSARSSSVTKLLHDWRGGDAGALDRLIPIVYQELRAIADRHLRAERPGHTLQPTALVHEVFLRLVGTDIRWQDRAHFMAVSARTMRRILVDYARTRKRVKRGGNWLRQTLDEGIVMGESSALDLVKLDEALIRLNARDKRAARAAELHYFGGLSYEDTAEVLAISPATVHRDLRLAKAWLYKELAGAEIT
jgi:RNA polymerase sigma factor (TIGR02999 family)